MDIIILIVLINVMVLACKTACYYSDKAREERGEL